ncbi:unnamed protein product [Rotaria sp. Silwood1]|nr:unnamed protein product [Rotaria sp. Silwood1]
MRRMLLYGSKEQTDEEEIINDRQLSDPSVHILDDHYTDCTKSVIMEPQHTINGSPLNFVEIFNHNYEQAKLFRSITTHIESTILYQTSKDMLARLHRITTIAKHIDPTTPFGGINMIFLGDFVQYPPVLDRPLYSNILSPTDTLANTLNTINQTHRQQQIRNKHPLFMAMQARLRTGQCTDDDHDRLCKRVVSSDNDVKSLTESPWNLAPMLVFRNEVRTNINNYGVFDETIKDAKFPVNMKYIQKPFITICRTQLPIVPAYAMTTHKCQGKILGHGVSDLVPPPYAKSDLANVYVPISCFTSADTMTILRHFP